MLQGDGMRLRMHARVDVLSTQKEERTGVHMYGNIRAMLAPIFQKVRDNQLQ